MGRGWGDLGWSQLCPKLALRHGSIAEASLGGFWNIRASGGSPNPSPCQVGELRDVLTYGPHGPCPGWKQNIKHLYCASCQNSVLRTRSSQVLKPLGEAASLQR